MDEQNLNYYLERTKTDYLIEFTTDLGAQQINFTTSKDRK